MSGQRGDTIDRLVAAFEAERTQLLSELAGDWFAFLAQDPTAPTGPVGGHVGDPAGASAAAQSVGAGSLSQPASDADLSGLAGAAEIDPIPQGLTQALAYATEGGKRLRPRLYFASLLTWLDPETICQPAYLRPALALEFVHSYSLIHDDLPAMDDDAYRRGRPSLHARFGEATAILTGDALLTLAFRLMTDPLAGGGAGALIPAKDASQPAGGALAGAKAPAAGAQLPTAQAYLQASRTLAICAGRRGMVGGQELDMDPDLLKSQTAIERMVVKKTCALFTAAVLMAAQLVGASAEDQARLQTYAINYGLAFQLRDDMADWEEDQAQGKITLMTPLKDREEGKERVMTLLDQARKAVQGLDTFGYFSDFLDSVTELMHKEWK